MYVCDFERDVDYSLNILMKNSGNKKKKKNIKKHSIFGQCVCFVCLCVCIYSTTRLGEQKKKTFRKFLHFWSMFKLSKRRAWIDHWYLCVYLFKYSDVMKINFQNIFFFFGFSESVRFYSLYDSLFSLKSTTIKKKKFGKKNQNQSREKLWGWWRK